MISTWRKRPSISVKSINPCVARKADGTKRGRDRDRIGSDQSLSAQRSEDDLGRRQRVRRLTDEAQIPQRVFDHGVG